MMNQGKHLLFTVLLMLWPSPQDAEGGSSAEERARKAVAIGSFDATGSAGELPASVSELIPSLILVSLDRSEFAPQMVDAFDGLLKTWQDSSFDSTSSARSIAAKLQESQMNFLIGGAIQSLRADEAAVRYLVYSDSAKVVLDSTYLARRSSLVDDLKRHSERLGANLKAAVRDGGRKGSIAMFRLLPRDRFKKLPVIRLPIGKEEVVAPWLETELQQQVASTFEKFPQVALHSFQDHVFESPAQARSFLRQRNRSASAFLHGEIIVGDQLAVNISLLESEQGRTISSFSTAVPVTQWSDLGEELSERLAETIAGCLKGDGSWRIEPTPPAGVRPEQFFADRGIHLTRPAGHTDPNDESNLLAAIVYLRKAIDLIQAQDRPENLALRADWHFQLGEIYLKTGQAEKAIAGYHAADSDGYGQKDVLYLQLGRAQMQANWLMEADRSLRSALEQGADQGVVLPLLGDALSQAGEAEKAIQIFRDYLKIQPDDFRVRHYLARQFHFMRHYSEEIAELERLRNIDSDAFDSGLLGNELARAHRSVGLERFAAGDLPGSVEAMIKASELDSEDPRIFLDLGALLRKSGRFDASQQALRRGLQIDLKEDNRFIPKLFEALSETYAVQRQFDQALATLEEGMTRFPNNGELARAYAAIEIQKTGRIAPALESLKGLLLKAEGNDVPTLKRLVEYQVMAGLYAEAKEWLQRLDKLPTTMASEPWTEYIRAEVERGLGDQRKAKYYLKRWQEGMEALIQSQDTPAVNYNYCIYHLLRGKDERKGLPYCEKALDDRYPELEPLIRRVQGALSYKLGRYEQAKEYLESAAYKIRYPWQRALAYYYLGMTQYALRDLEGATSSFTLGANELPGNKYSVLCQKKLEELD